MSSDIDHLGWLIKRVQHEHHRALDANLAKLGISLVQWNALREIDRHPGSSQRQLAERTFNSDQAFGTLVTRLEARGWIERGQGVGRAMVLALTPEGVRLLGEGLAVRAEVLKASFAGLRKEERAQLTSLLTRVLEARRPTG